jgi:hypothetical protein
MIKPDEYDNQIDFDQVINMNRVREMEAREQTERAERLKEDIRIAEENHILAEEIQERKKMDILDTLAEMKKNSYSYGSKANGE